MKHLAIFKGKAGEAILSGKKTIESRFSRIKNPPFGVIGSGDLVYIKPSGRDIIGQFRVKKVIFYSGLEKEDLWEIKKRYKRQLVVDETYWINKSDCNYATLIFIGDSSRFITSPLKFPKKDLRGWVVMQSGQRK